MTIDLVNFPYDVILAHGPGCNDGATAAWCVWRLLPDFYRNELQKEGGFYSKPEHREDEEENEQPAQKGPNEAFIHANAPEGAMKLQDKGFPVVFVFVQPSEGVPRKLIENKRVIVLDLDMGDALPPVVEAAAFVCLVDHHDSTSTTLHKHSQLLYETYRHKFATFVNTHKSESGASLSWKLTHSATPPPFVQIVRIGDTWQWQDYPELQARSVLKALHMRRTFRSFPDIEDTFQTWDQQFQSYIHKGKSVADYETALVKQIAKQCDLGFIQTNDGTVYTVAYTQASVLHSEVGAMIRYYAQKRFKMPIDICATWKYASFKGLVSISLRDGIPGINLAEVARNIKDGNGKGGGHAPAAGFSFFGLENFHKYISRERPLFELSKSVKDQPTLMTTNKDHIWFPVGISDTNKYQNYTKSAEIPVEHVTIT